MGLADRKVNLYVDMDGVVCNFIQSAIEAHQGISPVGDMVVSQVESWNFFEEVGMTWEEFFQPVLEWKGFWEYIPAYSHAAEFLFGIDALVKESGLDVTVSFCSTPIDDPDCYSGKLKWLKSHGFLNLADNLMLVKDKNTLIRTDAILVDDRQETVDTWRAEGGMGVLYPRQWNKGGVSLVEGDDESEKEGMLIALESVKQMLTFRELEIDMIESQGGINNFMQNKMEERSEDMSEDTPEFLNELNEEFPTNDNSLPDDLPSEDDGFMFHLGEGIEFTDLTEFLKSFKQEEEVTEEEIQEILESAEVEDVIEEALAEVTPLDEDEEVRSVSSTGAEKGTKLARFDLIPIEPLTELAKHFGRGSQKYDDHNYRKGYEWSKSYAACMRHLTQFWAGEDCDEETGTPHVISAAWHCFAMYEFMLHHPDFDDRYNYGE